MGKSSPSDPSNHDEYTVKAATKPGAKVYFRAWDPDDPSSNTGPVDPNDPELGRSAGQDNRRPPNTYLEGQWTSGEGGNTTIGRPADATGVARATLRVTPRPGDNFMVTPSCDTDKVSAITQEQFDRRNFPPGVAVSSILTMWRKLHINFSSFPNDAGHKNEAEDGNWVQFDAVWYEPN
ncbi:MAG: hypothetical protein ACUVYA_11725 [Planctomycetota bacterium]